jgi:hypothetical protein
MRKYLPNMTVVCVVCRLALQLQRLYINVSLQLLIILENGSAYANYNLCVLLSERRSKLICEKACDLTTDKLSRATSIGAQSFFIIMINSLYRTRFSTRYRDNRERSN